MVPAFLPALVIVFGLQELRVFFPSLAWYLKDTVGLSSLQLAPIAFGTVATVFLVPLFARRYGWHRLWQGAAVGLAVVRVAEQMVTIPAADFVLSATGVVLFLTACAAFLSLRLRGRVLSFFLGCTLDTAIRGFAGTLDLSWYDTWWAIIAVFVLAAAVVAVIARSEATRQSPATHDAGRSPRPSGARDDIAVLAIGPFLFLQMLIFQNFGWIAETFHLTPSGSFFAIMVGNAAVIALTSFCGTPLREFLEHRSHAAAEGTSPPGVEATGEAQG
ncbi:MAG: hypothetical protein HY465_05510, partial [Deltaproteobacteria bacterium]|nr:hypothetical protein [Deltaproteobacteria bacterium]